MTVATMDGALIRGENMRFKSAKKIFAVTLVQRQVCKALRTTTNA